MNTTAIFHDTATQLIAALPSAWWLYEVATDSIVDATPHWESVFGVPREAVLGPLDQRLASIIAADRPRVADAIRRAATTGAVQVAYTATAPHGPIDLVERLVPITDEQGLTIRVAGFISDVTQQRATERVVRGAQHVAALGALVRSVSHELNNMLGSILLAAEELASSLEGDPDRRALCNLVLDAAHRNRELTQQLQAFARVGVRATAVLDLNKVIWESVAVLRRSMPQRVMVVADLRAQRPQINGDVAQLQAALVALGLEARDLGGEITYESDSILLDESACASLPFDISPGEYVQVTIRFSDAMDIGRLQRRIFDPLESATSIADLGLGALYGTLVAHRGAIGIYGGLDDSAVVKLYLPRLQQPHARTATVSGVDLQANGTILLADDEPLVLSALGRVLTNLGFSVATATDGTQVLELLRDGGARYAAMICDLVMPGMHGEPLIREVRRIAPHLPLIVSSGLRRDEQPPGGDGPGFIAFLPKPVRRDELVRVLADALTPAG